MFIFHFANLYASLKRKRKTTNLTIRHLNAKLI